MVRNKVLHTRIYCPGYVCIRVIYHKEASFFVGTRTTVRVQNVGKDGHLKREKSRPFHKKTRKAPQDPSPLRSPSRPCPRQPHTRSRRLLAPGADKNRRNRSPDRVSYPHSQNNCGSTVKRAIEAVPGVARAEVSFPARRAWAWPSSAAAVPRDDTGGRRPGASGPGGHADVEETPAGAAAGAAAGGASLDDAGGAVLAAVVEAVEAVGFGAEASPDVELLVEGMMCQNNCGTTARNALLGASPAVVRAEVSFAEGRARVWLDRPAAAAAAARLGTAGGGGGGGGTGGVAGVAGGGGGAAAAAAAAAVDTSAALVAATAGLMVEALEAVGFDAAVAPAAVLKIEGMMCQNSCGSTVRKCLESVPGVGRAEVSFAGGRLARVWADGGARLPVSALVEAVEDVGFGARVVGPGEKKEEDDEVVPPPATVPSGGDGGGGSAAGGVNEAEASLPKMMLDVHGGSGDGAGGAGAMAIGVFSVSGMSCASCVGNVERFVSALAGVEDVRVALLAEKVGGRGGWV